MRLAYYSAGMAMIAGLCCCRGEEPALRVITSTSPAMSVLTNGGFEALEQNNPIGWVGWHQGYEVVLGESHSGTRAVKCVRSEATGERGISQTLTLNRQAAAPVLIRGWSKAHEVSGTPDSGYSLYADIVYVDGTPSWGRNIPFSCGTHDWQMRQLMISPDKPIRSITLHCLFRGHTGEAWFDDIELEEMSVPSGCLMYQGVPVEMPSIGAGPVASGTAAVKTVSAKGGLELGVKGSRIVSLRLGKDEFKAAAPCGLLVRDHAANSGFFFFENGICTELGLRLDVSFKPEGERILVEGTVTDTTGRDRAVTLACALPVDAQGWNWGQDARSSRRIDGEEDFSETVAVKSGVNGKMSRYPVAALWSPSEGLAVGVDMGLPAQSRLGYHAGLKQLYVAYDFGLSKEVRRSPGSARFRFVIFRLDPRWGFRSALQGLYEAFPQQFVKRVPSEGVWMPFTDIAKVPGFEDFGFGFQEGAPNVPFDDQHGILSFVYVEPASHWLPMPPEAPRTYASALNVLSNDLTNARGPELQRMASATLRSGIQTEDGQFAMHIEKAPWCDGAMFQLSPQPGIETNSQFVWTKARVMQQAIAATFARHPGNEPPVVGSAMRHPGLDGVYFDSLEMAAEELDYRRDHFSGAETPLVFDSDGRLCQMIMFATWEFARSVADKLHSEGKWTFANGALWKYAFPAPLLDVMGTEVNWAPGGRYQPDPDSLMNYRRALCRQKPYCFLMNTDYSKFGPGLVEKFFQRCLFYGMWPGFFDEAAASKDPYWASAKKWYDRDRALFRKYIPLLRTTTAAGWEPLTFAASDNSKLWLERFGPGTGKRVFITVMNDSETPQEGTVRIDWARLGRTRTGVARELVTGDEISLDLEKVHLQLGPQEVRLLMFE